MSAILRPYGAATTFRRALVTRGSIDLIAATGWTPAAGDVKISKDGGNVANVATLPTAVGGTGSVLFDWPVGAAELQCKEAVIQVVDAATKVIEDDSFAVETYGHESAMHPQLGLGTKVYGTFATGTLAKDTATTSLSGFTAGQLARRVLTVLSGAAARERVFLVDYVVTGGQLYWAPLLTVAPANADRFVIE